VTLSHVPPSELLGRITELELQQESDGATLKASTISQPAGKRVWHPSPSKTMVQKSSGQGKHGGSWLCSGSTPIYLLSKCAALCCCKHWSFLEFNQPKPALLNTLQELS